MKSLNNKGFTLIELVVVIIIAGILATIAIKQFAPMADTIRTEETKQEMDRLAIAIVGNPELRNNGIRSDFGYVGDIGALPPNLDALISNPGFATWKGPYIDNDLAQIPEDYKIDAWQTYYVYNGEVVITSSGSGNTISRQLAGSSGHLLQNTVSGNIFDLDGTPPGYDYIDSFTVRLIVPDGSGSMINRTTGIDAGGYFGFNSVPIGNHELELVFIPENDTLRRFVSVLPNSDIYGEYYLANNLWMSVGGETSAVPIGHWPLDETGGITAHDISGNTNHGTLYNMNPGHDWVTGKIDGALDFDGTNDYVQIPHADILNGTDELTYCAWVYPHTWSATRQVMAKSVHGGGSGRAQMGVFAEGNQLCGRAETLAGRMDLRTGLTPLNTWAHIALIFDGTSLKLYVDGTLRESMTFPATTLVQTDDPLNIGKRVGSSEYFFNGLIDDVRIYKDALGDLEITTLYNMGN